MLNKACRHILLLMVPLFLLASSGCGYAFLPRSTKKAVTRADISGKWAYDRVVIELNEDGTFTQSVKADDGRVRLHSGDWAIHGANFDLVALKPELGWDPKNPDLWVLERVNWYIIDAPFTVPDEKFLIFGAAVDFDPDIFMAFRRVPQTKP